MTQCSLSADAENSPKAGAALQALLTSDSVRNGTLAEGLHKLMRALCVQLSIDRVSITVRDSEQNDLIFAQTYVAAAADAKPHISSSSEPFASSTFAKPGLPFVADDISEHPALTLFQDQMHRHSGVRALLQLPIDVSGQLVGVINALVCDRSWTWTQEHLAFGNAIANLASLIVERDARRKAAQQRVDTANRLERQQSALARLMHEKALSGQTLDQELRSLSETTAEILGVERVSIWRFTPADDAIIGLDIYDQRDGSHASGMKIEYKDHPAYFDALLSDGVVVVDNISTDARTASFLPDYVPATGVASLLDIAMVTHKKTVGVVCAEKCGAAMVWTEEQKLFVSAITGLAALAIERYERVKAEDENVATTQRLSSHFTAVNTLMQSDTFQRGNFEVAMRQMQRVLCHQIGADYVKLHITAGSGSDELPSFSETYSSTSNDYAAARNKIMIADPEDLDTYSRQVSYADVRQHLDIPAKLLHLINTYDVRSVQQIPIRLNGSVVGFVRAWTCGRTVQWASGEMLTIAVIAQLSALVLERHHRRAIENKLRHANRAAEDASRAKSQFLANMSHEIRTPMNGVFGMTDLLLQTPLTQRQSQLVGTMQKSTTALLSIINDILDISRIESGKVELENKPFHLRTCIEEAIAIFTEEARRKGLFLALEIDRSCPDWVTGDAARLRQVCLNLIGNAMKFTLQGSIRLAVSSAMAGDGRTSIRFVLRDTGIGIDKDVQARLFRPFSQADGSITRRFGGTGLGLSISRSLIEMMGGTIALESELGAGTTIAFDIKLNKLKAQSVAQSSAASLSAWLSPESDPSQLSPRGKRRFGGRVLVAEDNPVNQEVTRELIGALGCSVLCVENGEEAVTALTTQQFDLILMDCQMPVMDGLTATRRIRALEVEGGKARIPIVAVTANAFAEDRDACLAAGMDGYLSKPFNGQQLDEILQRWLPAHLVIERRGANRPLPPPVEHDEPVIDPIMLEPMKRLRPEFYKRLLTTFLTHTPRLVEGIEDAARLQERPALRLAAHSLKSSAANVGASRLSALARDAETCAARGDLAAAADLAVGIRHAFDAVRDIFTAEIKRAELAATA